MSANPSIQCGLCGTSLTGGTDTFGTIGENLCVSCYFLFKPRDIDEENAQFREAFSQPKDDGGLIILPGYEFTCPLCKDVQLTVEVTEWETDTGIPTEGGTLIGCTSCDDCFVDHVDCAELHDLSHKAEQWARENVRVPR